MEADSADQALRIVRKLDGRVDLIISDIKMPGDMDGIDLAHSVRNSFPDLPVILISGFASDELIQKSGFAFIQKPFVPENILKAVEKAMPVKTNAAER